MIIKTSIGEICSPALVKSLTLSKTVSPSVKWVVTGGVGCEGSMRHYTSSLSPENHYGSLKSLSLQSRGPHCHSGDSADSVLGHTGRWDVVSVESRLVAWEFTSRSEERLCLRFRVSFMGTFDL